MEKRVLSVEQLNKMIGFMKKVNSVVDLLISKSELTAEEAKIAEEVKQATESYIRILADLPDSDAEFWAPVIRAVVTEIIKKVFGDLPDPLMNWILENLHKFDNLDFWARFLGL